MHFRVELFLALFLTLLLTGCGSESSEFIQKKLDVVIKDDLATIVEGIDPSGTLDTPYSKITKLKEFEDGKYSHLAEVDYFFLNGINKKVARKYRYLRSYNKWERYSNEYQSIE